MNSAGKSPKFQRWSNWMKELAGSLKFHIAKPARRHWKPIAIVLILIAAVLPALASAKPLKFGVSLSTGEIYSGYCCGSLVYRTSFYGADTSRALASLLIVTNSTWLASNEIYVYLWHLPKLDSVTLQVQSSTSLDEATWKDGGYVPLWDSSMGERPRLSVSQDPRIGTLSFQKVPHPEASFALLLEFSSRNEILLTVEFGLSDVWTFGIQYSHGNLSVSVIPNGGTG